MQRYPILNLTRKVFSSNNFPIVSCNQEIRNSLLQRIRKVLLNRKNYNIYFIFEITLKRVPFFMSFDKKLESIYVRMYVTK